MQMVRSSCGCTVADLPVPQTLRAGESIHLPLTIAPPVYGTSEATVSIVTDSPTTPLCAVHVSLLGDLTRIPQVTHQTPHVELTGLTPGEFLEDEIEVRTQEKESDVWISGLNCPRSVEWSLPAPPESVSLGGDVVDRAYCFRIAAECPEIGSQSFTLFPETTTKERASHQSTALAVSRLQPLSVVPSEIIMKETPLTEPISILVISQDDEKFVVQDTATVTVGRDQAVATSQTVTIDRAHVSDAERQRGYIEIHTSHSMCPTLRVPIAIQPEK